MNLAPPPGSEGTSRCSGSRAADDGASTDNGFEIGLVDLTDVPCLRTAKNDDPAPWSDRSLKRLNKAIKRRTDLVGVSPPTTPP